MTEKGGLWASPTPRCLLQSQGCPVSISQHPEDEHDHCSRVVGTFRKLQMCVLTLELQALQPRTDSPRPQFPHLLLALQPRKGRAPCLSFPIYSQLCTSGQAEPQASVSHLVSFAIYCCDKHRDQNQRRGEKGKGFFHLTAYGPSSRGDGAGTHGRDGSRCHGVALLTDLFLVVSQLS